MFRVPARAPEVDAAEQARTTASRTYRALVILLQFTDNPADTLGHKPSAFDSLLFSTDTYPTGSFRDYYGEVSRSQFDVVGVVTRWYTAPHPYSYYVNNQSGFGGYPQNAQVMAADAVALASADYDFSQFDNDGPDGIPGSGDDDGEIDGLFIVHAGPGGEETNLTTQIWSHKWNLKIPIGNHGVVARAYTSEPERWASSAA
jgi:immune inhibitor A